MAVVTIYRLAEEILKAISGGEIQNASNVSIAEIKVSIGQVLNKLLKTDYFDVNMKMKEAIPNGSVLALYENIAVTSYQGKSQSTLPIKPLKLPRNMGVYAIYPKKDAQSNYDLDKEFIPVQMGQGGLLKSQPLINDMLGQVYYEVFGNQIIYSKDLPSLFPDIVVAMRLAIMDITQYDDYDPLPILPEMEWDVKQEVMRIYGAEGVADYLVDSTSKQQQNVPVKDQKQT